MSKCVEKTKDKSEQIQEVNSIEQQASTEPVKKKKGRPRKEKQVTEQESTPVSEAQQSTQNGETPDVPTQKKRGRKKKEVVVEEKKKKKRGRKAQVKYFSSSIRKKIPLTTFLHDQNNAILHLDIDDKEEENKDATFKYSGHNGNTLLFDTVKDRSSSIERDTGSRADIGSRRADIIETVFEKLSSSDAPNLKTVKNEIEQLLDNDKNILSDYIDNNQNETPQSKDDNIDLRDLYEKRINFREAQDKLLVDKLEVLHKDESFISQLADKKPKKSVRDIERERKDVQELNRRKGYFELLYNFIHNEHWLEHTDVCCWWCCHKFDSLPIGMPVDYHTKNKKFRVKGVFCSFACMCAYRDIYAKKSETNSLVSYLYTKLTAEPVGTIIQRAPPREALKMFGGELTIEEFRNSTTESKLYKMVEYPMIVSRDYIEEIDIANVKNANLKVFDENTFNRVVELDDKCVQDARTRLSSQIEKTTVTLGNTIDKFIKIG